MVHLKHQSPCGYVVFYSTVIWQRRSASYYQTVILIQFIKTIYFQKKKAMNAAVGAPLSQFNTYKRKYQIYLKKKRKERLTKECLRKTKKHNRIRSDFLVFLMFCLEWSPCCHIRFSFSHPQMSSFHSFTLRVFSCLLFVSSSDFCSIISLVQFISEMFEFVSLSLVSPLFF